MGLSVLYHWAPADRYDRIRVEGLHIGRERTASSGHLPYICLSPNPSIAWSISGSMDHVSDIDLWDLWLVRLSDNDEVHIRPMYGNRIEEVQIFNPVPPDRLWWVGRRTQHGQPVDI